MTYSVKEIYYTLQGEGAQTGRAAVFCRFAGCNLWSGREEDRGTAVCRFCDTDFVGTDGVSGGKYKSPRDLATAIEHVWGSQTTNVEDKYVVFTGGEPALQLDRDLIKILRSQGFKVAIETNGTLNLPSGIDWVCVSPKSMAALLVESGSELKVVFPQDGLDLAALGRLEFSHFFMQPKDDENYEGNLKQVLSFCRKNPQWRISLQTHKLLQIP